MNNFKMKRNTKPH